MEDRAQCLEPECIRLRRELIEIKRHHSTCHRNCSFEASQGYVEGTNSARPGALSSSEGRTEPLCQPDGPSNKRRLPLAWVHTTAPRNPSASSPVIFAQSSDQFKRTFDWKEFADGLIEQVPTSEHWWGVIDSLEISQIIQEGTAIQFLLGQNPPALQTTFDKLQTSDGTEEGYLFTLVKQYAANTSNRARNARGMLKLLQLQKFVVLCLCASLSRLLRINQDKELFERKHRPRLCDITQISHGKSISEVSASRLWGAAILLNKVVGGLSAQGWSSRASELLLIWDLSSAQYGKLAKNAAKIHPYLVDRLSAPQYTKGFEQRPDWTPLYFPQLLYQILNKAIGVHRIALTLGYEHADDLKKLVNPWKFFWQPHDPEASPDVAIADLERPRRKADAWPVGCGIDQSILSEARTAFRKAKPHSDFGRWNTVQFVFEMLENSATSVAIRIVDQWVLKPDNICRAKDAIAGGTSEVQDEQLKFVVRGVCAFRFKHQGPKEEGPYPLEGLAVEERRGSVVVIIAVERLDQRNGCFRILEPGQDVCLDGNARIDFPGTGGGVGIFIDGDFG